MTVDRYSRQRQLPEVGDEGQCKLAQAAVLVVGAGGLGLPAAAYLAGAGVGRIGLVDGDRVEVGNLHRQVFYREADIGRLKVDAAADHLRQLNSDIDVETHPVRLLSANGESLVARYHIVLDAADNFATTYLLSDLCCGAGKFLVSASALGNSGYLGVFCGDGPGYRALFPTPPATAPDCTGAGVLGPVVATLGALQAQETLKLIVAPETALRGRLLSVDLWRHRFRLVDFSHAGNPDTATDIPLLARQELTGQDLLVDVRSAGEVAERPVAGALHLPYNGDQQGLADLPAAAGRTIFCCTSGQRARRAAESLLRADPVARTGIWIIE